MRGIQNTAVGLETVITTESPSRNIADVLAQELANLSTAVKPNASNILMSDNVTTVEQAITNCTQTFSVDINGTTDANGNINTGILKTVLPPISGVIFDPDSTSYDGLYVPFISPVTDLLYLHVNNFSNVSQTGVTVKGKVHITRRK